MKKFHRFFLPSIPGADVFDIEDPKLVHQLTTVLRYEVEDQFIVFTEGSDDHIVAITSLSKRAVTVSKVSIVPAIPMPSQRVVAAVSIIKRDLFEFVVQKLTELGVHTIVPLLSTRTIKQSVRLDRLQEISREAAEQCGRNTLVTIHEPMTLDKCFKTFPYQSVVFDPRESETNSEKSDTLVFYIGPEGGWSEEDEKIFAQHGVSYKKLGPTILRTETAAIVGAHSILSSILNV